MTSIFQRLSFFIFLAVVVAGCHTPSLKKFERIELGMEKVDVIDLVGGPKMSDRRNGQDRWTYFFYENGETQKREIRFSGIKVIYVGEYQPPRISAEEQDRIFAEQNAALQNRKQNEVQQRASLPTFTDFEEFIQGRNRVRYVPKEIPIQPGTRVTR